MSRALLLLLVAGCADEAASLPTTPPPPDGARVVHLGEHVDAAGEALVTLDGAGVERVEVHLDGAARVIELDAACGGADVADWQGEPHAAGFWFRPRAVGAEVVSLALDDCDRVRIWARGAPVPLVRRERSLVWTDAEVLDDPTVVGARRVLDAAGGELPGGVLLDRWFRRFATTLHSERAAPAQWMDELAVTLGPDPALWDLDALPFVVTGVHNRIDLAPRGGGCGELRVSLASTHPTYAPLHLLFIFRQVPRDDDAAPDGSLHCGGTARRWARLSAVDGHAFRDAAAALLGETLRGDRFLLAETVELTVSPWEWRQWVPSGDTLDNPPLFQTVAVPLVNAGGPLRDQFLAFVSENAAGLAARELELPSPFRAQSARVAPSVPSERLDLSGLSPEIAGAHPSLADAIEIVGCPRCHTENASFVHTQTDRTFSPFYDLELDARAEHLDALNTAVAPPLPPFGPLQAP